MSVKDFLTNEKVNGRFDNPFTLVNYAISMAQKMIAHGDVGSSNLSTEILDMIAEGKDSYELEMLDQEEGEEDEEIEAHPISKTLSKHIPEEEMVENKG